MKHQAEVLGVVTIERLYEPVPFARVFVCSVRQDGLQVYIRTCTPAYEQDRVGFRGSRLRLYIRLLMCLLQHEPSWKFVACSSSAGFAAWGTDIAAESWQRGHRHRK